MAVKSKSKVGSAFLASMVLKPSDDDLHKEEEDQELARLLHKSREIQMEEARANYKKLVLEGKAEARPKAFVMIVDDESYNCEVLKSMAISMGVDPQRIIVCMSGKEALSKLKTVQKECGRISLVLTDLSMPMMDGYRFIKKFRRLEGE